MLSPSASAGPLAELRSAVFVAPFERELDHDFVPHVTIGQGLDQSRLASVLEACAGYRDRQIRVEALHLLEQRHDDRGRRWVPVADMTLGPPVIVGRGGLPTELSSGELVDPEAAAWLGEALGPNSGHDPGPSGSRPLVTVARSEASVVGVARGWTAGPAAELVELTVGDPDDGSAEHLRAAWWSAAADRGVLGPFTR